MHTYTYITQDCTRAREHTGWIYNVVNRDHFLTIHTYTSLKVMILTLWFIFFQILK